MKKTLVSMAFLFIGITSLLAQNSSRTEIYKAEDGKDIKLHLYGHASLAIEADGNMIYLDPVKGMTDYSKEKRADVVFVTHSHGDHFDMNTIKSISKPTTHIYCDSITSTKINDANVTSLKPGDIIKLENGIKVEVIPAYNITKEHIQFHSKEKKECGYLFNVGKTRIYVAGDTENTEEMKSLKDIDIAFLPVNQPYTMTVEQAIDAIKAMRPTIFYPYHYGNTDIKPLEQGVKQFTTIKIRGME